MLSFKKNPDLADRLAGIGAALSGLSQGRVADLSSYRDRIQGRANHQKILGNQDLMGQFTPQQKTMLANMAPGVAQKYLAEHLFPQMPQYRYGTDYHPGGKAIVGEDGPEIVDLPKGARVRPNPATVLEGLSPQLAQQYLDLRPEQQEEFIRRMDERPQAPQPNGGGVGAPAPNPEDAYDPDLMEGVGQNPGGMFHREDARLGSQPGSSFAPGQEFRTADSSQLQINGVGEASALNSAARTFQGFMKSLDDYETTFRGDAKPGEPPQGSTMWPGKRNDQLGIAHRDLQMQMKELYNLGVLNGPDLDLMNQILIDPTSVAGNVMDVFGGDKDMEKRIPANIDQVRRLMINRTTPALQQLGVDPASLMPEKKPDLGDLSDDDLLRALQGGN